MDGGEKTYTFNKDDFSYAKEQNRET